MLLCSYRFVVFKQKAAYEVRSSDWSSDVFSSDLYEQGSREAAVTTGLAGNVGDAVTSRRQGLEELRGRLNSSTSAAERADMSARLQLEQAQMMNDQMGLQAIELQRRAKAEANYQRSLASNRAEIDKLRTEAGVNP